MWSTGCIFFFYTRPRCNYCLFVCFDHNTVWEINSCALFELKKQVPSHQRMWHLHSAGYFPLSGSLIRFPSARAKGTSGHLTGTLSAPLKTQVNWWINHNLQLLLEYRDPRKCLREHIDDILKSYLFTVFKALNTYMFRVGGWRILAYLAGTIMSLHSHVVSMLLRL